MKQLTKEQRYQIEAYLKAGKSKDFISEHLGVHRSSIFRECKRNGLKYGGYSARLAHEYAQERKDRYSTNRTFTEDCKRTVKKYLEDKWSPQQIVGYCNRMNTPIVSHERIYQYIRKDKQEGGDLYKNCRHQLKNRKRPVGKHMPIANRTPISERPIEVDEKLRFGDWEMDTIIGVEQKGAILTLIERKTNFIFIRKLDGKWSQGVKKQVINTLLPYKDFVYTITTDNGPEFAEHLFITKKIKSKIYFANPYCSWEKGAIEHANKLIRQYIPKGENIDQYTQKQLTKIQHNINNRPREKLEFYSPKDIFYKFVNGIVAFDT